MIRFGIVGAGNIAIKFAKDIQVVEGVKLVSVASRSLEKSKKFALEHNIKYAFGSYKEMAESKTIDAVYIATPHIFHKENAFDFMKNHIHVLCEKPMSVNQNEVETMIEEAKKNNILLMEAMWTRYLPAIQKAKELIDSKSFGKITSCTFSFCANIGENAPIDGRHLNPNLAGGSLLDVGIYPMSLLLYLIGEQVEYTSVNHLMYDTKVDRFVEMKGLVNKVVPFTLNSGFDREDLDAVIEFEKGKIVIPEFFAATKLIVNEQTYNYPHKESGFEYEIESFRDSIVNGNLENEIMSYDESIKLISELDKVRKIMRFKYPFE